MAKNIKQENPWVYQPYIIGNIEEEKVYQSMFEQYADFLKERNNLVICEEKEYRLYEEKKYMHYIISVDEFYVPESKFYLRKHNQHFILIDQIRGQNIRYVDSETTRSHKIELTDLQFAMYSKDIVHCVYSINLKMIRENNRKQISNREVMFPNLDICFYRSISNEELLFYVEALRLCINFQLKPYALMGIKYCGYNEDIYMVLEQLSRYLMLCRIKGNVNSHVFIEQIERLISACQIEKINIGI